MAVGFADAQDVLETANEHRVGLFHVELEIAQEDDLPRVGVGEGAFEQLEDIQRVGAGGDPAFLHIDQALGGGPGVNGALQAGADGGDFRFGASLFGTDDGETGIAGAQIGGELVLHFE